MKELSYAIGMSMGGNLVNSGLNGIDVTEFSKAIADVLESKETTMSPQDADKLIQEFFEKRNNEMSQTNLKAGEEFLAENKKREGVVTLPSGLQYEIMTEGTGVKPSATDKVKCHYHGTLIDGTIFDSSVQRGQPAVFGVNQVIKGWVEALQLMPVGSKWKLFIPAELGYGNQGAGQVISPNSALIFEVELLGIE